MALYINKNMVDGVEELPRLTEEEFLAIPIAERPKIWVKRNATETDRGITAEDVEYDNTQSGLSATDVQGAIDEACDRDKWIYAGEITTSTTASFPVAVTKEWLFVCYSNDGVSILGSLHIECNGGIGNGYSVGPVVLSRASTTISMTSTTNHRVKFYYKIY